MNKENTRDVPEMKFIMNREYNADEILDNIKHVMNVCKEYDYLYKNSKNEMMVKIREWDPVFYNRHYRVCKTIVFEEDINELLSMIDAKKRLENKESTLEDEDKKISDTYNNKYVTPILNKKELVEEREKKNK